METTLKPRRRFKIVLAVSLALNLLFVGILAGAFWRTTGHGGQGHRGPGLQNYAAPYVGALPREDRRALQGKLRAAHPGLDRKQRRARYAQMLEALRATPFEPAAVEAVLRQQSQASLGVLETGQMEWLATVQAMDADERAVYADRLEERLKRGPRRKGKKRRAAE